MLRFRKDIPLFPQGRKKAFTLSFDDGVTQDKPFIDLLKKYRLKATFNLNSGWFGSQDWLMQPGLDVSHNKFDKEEIAVIYDGFEIAVHTKTHLNLAAVPPGTVCYEVLSDKQELEEITKAPVRGMAYPFGTTNQAVMDALKMTGVEYARTVKSTHSFDLPEDLYLWNPTCSYQDEQIFQLANDFLTEIQLERYQNPRLFYVWGHSYEFEGRNHWEHIERFLAKLSGHDEDVWYATNIEICDYLNAVKQMRYSANGKYLYNPTAFTVWMYIMEQVVEIKSGETVCVEWEKSIK